MMVFLTYNTSEMRRVRWVYDEDYDTIGSYAYDTEEETRVAEEEELAKLSTGEWVALGCIVEHKCKECGSYVEDDSLWGIVIEPDEAKLREFERVHMEQR